MNFYFFLIILKYLNIFLDLKDRVDWGWGGRGVSESKDNEIISD